MNYRYRRAQQRNWEIETHPWFLLFTEFLVKGIALTKVRKVVDLVNLRHRNTAIVVHLRTHLEHVVIEAFLMLEFGIQPAFLCRRGIRPIFECAFHWTIVYRALTAFYSRSEARPHKRAGRKLPPHDSIYYSIFWRFMSRKKEQIFRSTLKIGVSKSEEFDESYHPRHWDWLPQARQSPIHSDFRSWRRGSHSILPTVRRRSIQTTQASQFALSDPRHITIGESSMQSRRLRIAHTDSLSIR